MRKFVGIALLSLLVLPARAAADTPLYVGFLEGPQIDGTDAVSAQTHVRVAFRKDDAVWKSMPSDFSTPDALALAPRAYPNSATWTVVFDGRSRGSMASRSPNSLHWYADIGTQLPTTKAVPVIRSGAADFRYGSGVQATIRPVLLVSTQSDQAPGAWDPQGWKRSPLSAEERRLALAAFRGKVPTSERCKTPDVAHRIAYKDDAVTIVKSYRDKDGTVLFGARLADTGANCDFFDDETFFDYWFTINRQNRVRYLDSQMTPVEAADLDRSGRSAWLFFTSRGEDTDGYELFYDDFAKKVRYQWTYH